MHAKTYVSKGGIWTHGCSEHKYVHMYVFTYLSIKLFILLRGWNTWAAFNSQLHNTGQYVGHIDKEQIGSQIGSFWGRNQRRRGTRYTSTPTLVHLFHKLQELYTYLFQRHCNREVFTSIQRLRMFAKTLHSFITLFVGFIRLGVPD
jgi:hypothetical protein